MTGHQPKLGVGGEEFDQMAAFYRKGQGQVVDYLTAPCKPLHLGGYKYYSFLKREKGKLLVDLKPDPEGSGRGNIDIFKCLKVMADAHRDNAVTLEMRFRFHRASIFRRGKRYARVEASGKLTGFMKKKKWSNRILVFGKKVFSVPGLRRTPVKALSYSLPASLGRKTLTIGEVEFQRIAGKPKKTIRGAWKGTLRSDKILKDTKYWLECETTFKPGFEKVHKEPKLKQKKYKELWKEGQAWAPSFCKALGDLHKSLHPYDASAVKKAFADLDALQKTWNEKIFQPVDAIAKDLKRELKRTGF